MSNDLHRRIAGLERQLDQVECAAPQIRKAFVAWTILWPMVTLLLAELLLPAGRPAIFLAVSLIAMIQFVVLSLAARRRLEQLFGELHPSTDCTGDDSNGE